MASPRAAKARARIATSSSSPSSAGGGADTIAAIATAVGAGGVGIVRASGPEAATILARVVGVPVARLRDRVLGHGHARDGSGEPIDEVLFVLMRGPRSFTGEDVAELHGHGGAVNLGRLLRAVLAAGARMAEPGEFTRRAFENGRLDLTRAEAIADIVNAGSERALRLAQGQLRGALGERIARLRADALALRAEIEASIDFPEDDLELSAPGGLADRADDAARQCGQLAASYGLGGAVKRGIEVAIRGPVNAGKSSLINALLGEERALVADEPGTTRDVVEGRGVWHGVPVTVLDTAGEREATSEVERRGIELGRRRSAAADVEIVLEPAPVAAGDRTAAGGESAGPGRGARTLRVLSKSDLVPSELRLPGRLATSAVTGEGLEALRRAVVDLATGGAADAGDELVVTSERQRQLLERAAAALAAAAGGMRNGLAAEAVAVELREAGEHLAAILGEAVDDEMLDALFARFCIGK